MKNIKKKGMSQIQSQVGAALSQALKKSSARPEIRQAAGNYKLSLKLKM